MARIDVVMPQMGESIAEGTMSRWLKKVGDTIKRDEPLFEISTDKVDAEIPAPSAGILVEILVTDGQTVPVQAVVARLETDASAAAAMPAQAPSEPAASGPAAAAGGGAPPAIESVAERASVPNHSTAHPILPAAAGATAPLGASTAPGASSGSFEDRLRTKSSPLVRKIAAEHGIQIAGLQGSGIAGRVTKKDILQAIEAGVTTPSAASAPGLRPGAAPAPMASMYAPGGFGFEPPVVQPWPGDVVEPMSKIRRLTAGHMVYSKQTSAHVTTFFEMDLTRVARIRQRMRADFEAQYGEKLTFLPFITQAVVQGLRKFPVINAAVRGTDIVFRKQYNIGIAVALDWGLIVPVVKQADSLSLVGLTRNINDLAGRARNKKLKPEDVQDASFTITNPGVFGSVVGTPVIPQPTVAILCLGAIEKRPKVIAGADGEDTIAIRTCAYFSLSFDHRIVDGSDADAFMAFLKKQLETIPDTGF
ncbi:MAG: 2-oxo acid dehydrogenase subunit E2 [Gemmatimonadaceae bacterium]|nr:2-oxo acid dehydrogenase subunit E2 [Gemmatimonadaceae bacterium]